MARKWSFWLRAWTAGLLFAWGGAQAATTEWSTVSGQVTDANGVPLQGVAVSIKGKVRAHTDAGGMYTVSRVAPRHRVAIEFSKVGYSSTFGVARLARWVRVDGKGRSQNDFDDDHPECVPHDGGDDDGHHHRAGKGHGHGGHHPKCVRKVRKQATVSKAMVKAGSPQPVVVADGGTFTAEGFKVTLPPDSLDATGTVDLTITPLDVSTSQIAAAPGDFGARTRGDQPVRLESFSMADYSFTQNGAPINLRRGARARIELLLPANTPLVVGQVTPLWYFDPQRGLWREEGSGRVAASTSQPGRLAVFGTVRHFSWWNSDQPVEQTAVAGRVVDQAGNAVSGASVEGWGVDYAGHSYAVRTHADGTYCIQVRSASTTHLTATLIMGGTTTSASIDFTADGTQSTCPSGPRLPAPDIVLSRELGCISGQVLDAADAPLANASVYTSAGAHTVTDAAGAFELTAPANVSVVVYAENPLTYAPVRVTVPPAGGACATAVLRPGNGGGTVACVRGVITSCDEPLTGMPLRVVDEMGLPLGEAITDDNGAYCFDNLPFPAALRVQAIDYFERDVTTLNAGTCAQNLCAEASYDWGCW